MEGGGGGGGTIPTDGIVGIVRDNASDYAKISKMWTYYGHYGIVYMVSFYITYN